MKLRFVSILAWLFMAAPALCAAPAWVRISDRNAQVLLRAVAGFSPEQASLLGVEGHDGESIDMGPRVYERSNEVLRAARSTLLRRRADATTPEVREDLAILIDTADRQLAHARLEHELLLPYVDVSKTVFEGIRALLDPRVAKARQAFAVQRLRRYAGLGKNSQALAVQARARTEERLGLKHLLGPYKAEVEQNLADSPRLVQGLRTLLMQSGLEGWQPAFDTLAKQLADYDAWVRTTVLPRARTDNRLPPALYADNLRQLGVTVAPDELIRRAQVAYAEIRNEMQALAPLVAKEKGFASTDYRDVIRELKKNAFKNEEILPAYQRTLAAIEDLLRTQRIVTVPERKVAIRPASEAESAVEPAPSMSVPRLIGNTGEYGEFVIPLSVPATGGESLKNDDDTFQAATWSMTAHEARPGHELQFASMIEGGVSIARAVFAFNSANAEGWALYAEAEMRPYFPLDGQLIGLQLRLLRAARAFLDPMLNLGRITPQQAATLLRDEVVLSPGMTKQEVDRYTFRLPGQATSYFFGYQAMMHTRGQAELALGKKFDRRRFHDFVLAQGLLPPALLQKAVLESFVPAELERTK
jgi:uncharacterized protein (DUF885 family)